MPGIDSGAGGGKRNVLNPEHIKAGIKSNAPAGAVIVFPSGFR